MSDKNVTLELRHRQVEMIQNMHKKNSFVIQCIQLLAFRLIANKYTTNKLTLVNWTLDPSIISFVS